MRGVSMARGKKPGWMIEIAQERMDILFNRAEKEYKEHPWLQIMLQSSLTLKAALQF